MLLNMNSVLLHLFKAKEVKSTISKLIHDEKILSILITISVLKLDKFKLIIDEQLSNISFIYSTFSVLNELILSFSNLDIPLNIPDIFFTLLVLYPDKFKDFILEHPKNISSIDSTQS